MVTRMAARAAVVGTLPATVAMVVVVVRPMVEMERGAMAAILALPAKLAAPATVARAAAVAVQATLVVAKVVAAVVVAAAIAVAVAAGSPVQHSNKRLMDGCPALIT